MMKEIAIIIVNYNSQELVCKCLKSFGNIDVSNLFFVVIDNSEKPSTDMLKKLFPEVAILYPGSNLGYAGGCNLGIRYALKFKAKFVLLLNPDTRAKSDFIKPLVSTLKMNEHLGMVGPLILEDTIDQKIWAGPGKMNWFSGGPKHIWDDGCLAIKNPIPVPFLSGCAMLLRIEAVHQVGVMDERYFLYFEDTDYSQAFLSSGWGIAIVPEARLLHAPSSIIGHQSPLYVYYFSRNRIWFMRRWARWYHYLVFMTFNTLVKLPGAVIVFGLMRRKPCLIRAFLKGFQDGLLSYKKFY